MYTVFIQHFILMKKHNKHNVMLFIYRPRLVFFVRAGLNHFINDVIALLSETFETKKVTVTHYPQIDEGSVY